MRGNKIFGAVALAWLAVVAVAAHAQRNPSPQHLLPQSQANPQKNQNQGSAKKNAGPPVHRFGDWLKSYRNLPLDQQEKALERDPRFKNLPPQQQANLRERLRQFNSLPPEQRERAFRRIEFLATLTQEQRTQIRQANQQLQGLPEDRRLMVHKALRHLRQMDPQQREEVMQSERFKSAFSPQEQSILGQLSAINPQGEGGAAPGAQPK